MTTKNWPKAAKRDVKKARLWRSGGGTPKTRTELTLRLSKETRGQRHDHKWGGWGSNPRPADYDSARLPVAQVLQRPDLGI